MSIKQTFTRTPKRKERKTIRLPAPPPPEANTYQNYDPVNSAERNRNQNCVTIPEHPAENTIVDHYQNYVTNPHHPVENTIVNPYQNYVNFPEHPAENTTVNQYQNCLTVPDHPAESTTVNQYQNYVTIPQQPAETTVVNPYQTYVTIPEHIAESTAVVNQYQIKQSTEIIPTFVPTGAIKENYYDSNPQRSLNRDDLIVDLSKLSVQESPLDHTYETLHNYSDKPESRTPYKPRRESSGSRIKRFFSRNSTENISLAAR